MDSFIKAYALMTKALLTELGGKERETEELRTEIDAMVESAYQILLTLDAALYDDLQSQLDALIALNSEAEITQQAWSGRLN